ncbi:MAG: hypothetical protein U9Q81_08785, partial [Pseudomonadota bacterium]|nr:hypothetical protein [Pseudomonadota bacterium]
VLEDGKNLYDLICDYETLCAGRDFPGAECNRSVLEQLGFPVTRRYRGGLLPDVCGRVSPLPNREKIAFLPGSNGNVVEVRRRIDFQTLFERHSGYAFFQYVAEELARQFELILLSAPAGHQEISGILCGQMADLILAIDLDSPAMESNPSYEACMQLARQVRSSNGRRIDVKSVRGQPPEEVVQMILKSHENAG